jgi:hypothetical protein
MGVKRNPERWLSEISVCEARKLFIAVEINKTLTLDFNWEQLINKS